MEKVITNTIAIYESIWDRQKGEIPYIKAIPLKTHIQENGEQKNRTKTKNILKLTIMHDQSKTNE